MKKFISMTSFFVIAMVILPILLNAEASKKLSVQQLVPLEYIPEPINVDDTCYTADESKKCGKSDVSISQIQAIEQAYIDTATNQLKKTYAVKGEFTNREKTSAENCRVKAKIGEISEEVVFNRIDYKKNYLFFVELRPPATGSGSTLTVQFDACSTHINEKNPRDNIREIRVNARKYNTSGSGLPDLIVTRVDSKSYYDEQNVKKVVFLTYINNIGRTALGLNEQATAGLSINMQASQNNNLPRMVSGSTYISIYKYTLNQFIQGRNLIRAEADSQGASTEANENNNKREYVVLIEDANFLRSEMYSNSKRKLFMPMTYYVPSSEVNPQKIPQKDYLLTVQLVNIDQSINSGELKIVIIPMYSRKTFTYKENISNWNTGFENMKTFTLTSVPLSRREIQNQMTITVYLNDEKLIHTYTLADLFYGTQYK